MEQLFCHLIGDYWLQSDWMSSNKTKSYIPAFCHALTYTLVFLFLTTSWKALLIIGGTHFLIDRFRLARYICYIKNLIAPWKIIPCKGCDQIKADPNMKFQTTWHNQYCWPSLELPVKSWEVCKATGYDPERPIWLTTWLLIITDNLTHLMINYFALKWFN